MHDYDLIPMANPSSNATQGKRPLPSIEEMQRHFLDIFNAPREVDADDALRSSFAHAQESRGWK